MPKCRQVYRAPGYWLRAADECTRNRADISSAMVAAIGTGDAFSKGRDFAAWLGLVPKQVSTGDRTILGKISKRGNRGLRVLFVQAAWVVLVKRKSRECLGPDRWLEAAKIVQYLRRGLREIQRDGGPVFPARASTGDPNGLLRSVR